MSILIYSIICEMIKMQIVSKVSTFIINNN